MLFLGLEEGGHEELNNIDVGPFDNWSRLPPRKFSKCFPKGLETGGRLTFHRRHGNSATLFRVAVRK